MNVLFMPRAVAAAMASPTRWRAAGMSAAARWYSAMLIW
jgi:hypothetical protein